MEKPNITYYMGAGASYHSVPIVEEFPDLLRKFKAKCLGIHFGREKEGLRNKFLESLDKFTEKADEYGTIDTYAKYLSIIPSKTHELMELKIVLALFFVTWQSLSKKAKNEIHDHPGASLNRYDINDKRYTKLLVPLLKYNEGIKKVKIHPSFKFITWNYDFQLENALREMCEDEDLDETLNRCVYPNIKVLDQSTISSFGPDIIHLNGIAGLYQIKGTECNSAYRVNNTDLQTALKNALDFYQSFDRYQINIKNFFHFAWERIGISDEEKEKNVSFKAFNLSKEIFSKTDYLVITGYSFPLFNRDIDLELFKSLKPDIKKIYWYNKNMNKELLSDLFQVNQSKIENVWREDNFHIPYNFRA